jgi:hypothetical protein
MESIEQHKVSVRGIRMTLAFVKGKLRVFINVSIHDGICEISR